MQLNYPEIRLANGTYRRAPVSGLVLWCGPFALAVVTGLPYDTCREKLRAVEQRRLNAQAKARGLKPGYWKARIKGVSDHLLATTAERLGVKVAWHNIRHGRTSGPTLITFTRDHTVKDRVYLVVAGWHYVTICNGILYHAHHDPLPVEDAPKYRKARVARWAEVKPLPAAIKAIEAA
jgi:hypothetical protein